MADADRERLIEILKLGSCPSPYLCDENCKYANLERCYEERTADLLLEHGVTALPCKVGDTIYQTDGVRIYTSTIYEITYTENKVIFVTENVDFDERAINNSIFLDREEAERALKEREKYDLSLEI